MILKLNILDISFLKFLNIIKFLLINIYKYLKFKK